MYINNASKILHVMYSSMSFILSPFPTHRIIADASIACDRKVPFARILTLTYLLTERNSGETCAKIAQNVFALV